MPLVTIDPALPLLEVNGVLWQIPVPDPVAVAMKVKPFLLFFLMNSERKPVLLDEFGVLHCHKLDVCVVSLSHQWIEKV